MNIIITQWALDSYLELTHAKVFSPDEYRSIIRPDVMLLKSFPHNPKFSQGKFWSAAQDMSRQIIPNGFKMKWHQIGSGLVQLRATVGIFDNDCFLCEAYVKQNDKYDKRKLTRFKTFLQLIKDDRYIIRGALT